MIKTYTKINNFSIKKNNKKNYHKCSTKIKLVLVLIYWLESKKLYSIL